MKCLPSLIVCIFLFSLSGNAQFQMDWNADINLELSAAGSDAHYGYNNFHRDYTKTSFDLTQANLIAGFEFNPCCKINTHLLINRQVAQRAGLFREFELYEVVYAKLNIQWSSSNTPWSIVGGRLINPFGRFYENQLYSDRHILDTPLAYSYSTNISKNVGFVPLLVEDDSYSELLRDDHPIFRDWGTPVLSRLGYLTGIQVQYDLPEKLNASILFAKNAPNVYVESFFGEGWSLISHFNYRINYFSKLGLSFSYSPFVEENYISDRLTLSDFHQTIIGLDYSFEYGFWELCGEIIAAWYSVPIFNILLDDYSLDGIFFTLNTTSFYIDLKYEFPFLTGAYAAYRFDILSFGEGPDGNGGRTEWDQEVIRNALSFGYRINSFWELKLSLADQNVKGRDWDQSTFRLMTSFFW